jgi:hypothetical protein
LIDCGYWTSATLDYNIKHDFGKPKQKLLAKLKAAPPLK